MASHRVVCGAVVMVTVMLAFLQLSATAEERRSSSSRGRSSSSASSSSFRGNNRGRAGSGAGQTRGQDQDLPYYMMCPEVRCPQLPRDCQTVEYLVYEYQYDARGGNGLVNVRCQSCDYCLDGPHTAAARGIRSYGNNRLQEVKEKSPCSMVQCPLLPESCIDVRLTTVLISGQQCDPCLACYDQTIVNLL